MGQHKHNPTAIAAKKGELEPRPKGPGKRERERMMHAECQRLLYGPLIKAYGKQMMEEGSLNENG